MIIAEANKKSEQLRGEGDAERNRIFAEAYGKDEEFYTFYRSMNAYRGALDSKQDVLVLQPDSEFFRYFNTDASN